MELDRSWSHDTISCLSEPTPCALFHTVGGHRVPVAWGQTILMLRSQSLLMMRSQKLEKLSCKGYSGRGVTLLYSQGMVLHKLWKKNSSKQRKSLSDAAKSGQEKQSAPKNSATKSAPISVGTVAAKSGQEKERMADATICAPINAATKSGQEKEKMADAVICAPITAATKSGQEKEKMVETSKKAPGESSNKQQAIKSSKEAPGKKQYKKKGPATISLHNYYLRGCAEKKKDILVQFRRAHLLRSLDKECFLVRFNDLYDLFNVDALDVLLIRCFTLSMIFEAKAKIVPVGFLDPELMSLSTITSDRSYVVNYVAKALQKYVKQKLIMFAHNTIGHWVLVVVIPKWKKVLYFDSLRTQARDHKQLKEVLNEAFISYCTLKKVARESLQHVTKFQCHQQPPSKACGIMSSIT
ncbi:unnamed protein product [Urochloa decumbens]|uniref:Ubiquitin-like protease family profile domain-containing protein n=1 Tax=Urochloa decumbens TaxID=240449 RepID=A0ABC8XZP1_9POAL